MPTDGWTNLPQERLRQTGVWAKCPHEADHEHQLVRGGTPFEKNGVPPSLGRKILGAVWTLRGEPLHFWVMDLFSGWQSMQKAADLFNAARLAEGNAARVEVVSVDYQRWYRRRRSGQAEDAEWVQTQETESQVV